MHRPIILIILLLGLTGLSGCQEKAKAPEPDMMALRQAVMKKTQEIYLIHLKLDSASSEITKAELKARDGDCSDTEYLTAEAYRNLQNADEDLLELGRELQVLFNLDIDVAGGN
jgi:chromosome segregation ATPase